MMTTLFVSDLHLSKDRPDKVSLFKKLLAGPARQAKALYILGDLFDDFWIGCDDKTPPNPEIIEALKNYSASTNTVLIIMRGNRDFHLDSQFADMTGCQLIDDPSEIILDNEKVLLMHGDTLCTDDKKYQQWRRFITHPLIKYVYSLLPLSFRKRISHRVRRYTVEATQKKPPEIIDASHTAVIEAMKQYDTKMIIHGHTHRQAKHEFELDGKAATRIVLGDWYEKDCVLIHDEQGFRFERVENYISNNN